MSTPFAPMRGFTLLEVLIALALMSLIGTILIESLHVGGRAWQQVTRTAVNVDEIARAQNFLRQRLNTMYPPGSPAGVAAADRSFVGENNLLEFSGAAPGDPGIGFARYRLALSSAQTSDLVVRYRPEDGESPPVHGSDWSSERLLEHTEGLVIQFWEESAGTPGHWATHWGDATRLPRLIRIDVRFADHDARRWPPLYVEPRIDTRATCVFDVVSRRCRGSV